MVNYTSSTKSPKNGNSEKTVFSIGFLTGFSLKTRLRSYGFYDLNRAIIISINRVCPGVY